MQIVDPVTIRFVTATPAPQLPNDISTIYIVSKKTATGASTADFNFGQGDERHRAVQVRVVQARRPRRDGAERRVLGTEAGVAEGDLPHHPERPTRVAALLSGDVDAIENVPTADFVKIKANTAYQTSTKTSHRVIFYHVDQFRDPSPFVFDKSGKPLDRNPLKDLRVRPGDLEGDRPQRRSRTG